MPGGAGVSGRVAETAVGDAASGDEDPDATLDDLREAVATLEETSRTARRVLGGAHPVAGSIEVALKASRAALAARETPPGSSKASN